MSTDNTAVIRQLEREVELLRSEKALYARMIAAALNGKRHPREPDNDGRLNAIRAMVSGLDLVRDKYRTEQSLRAQEERGRIESQTQLEHIRRGADMYGVMQSMALQGKKHPKEPHMDGRLDAIRSLVAHNAKLVAELAEMQRLYERATRQAMEAERRAEKWEKSARRVQKENFRLMGMEPNQ